MAQFESLARDMSIDVIEMAAGTYHGWRAADLPDRKANPLTIRPAPGATVIFDAANDGDYGNRAFGLMGASHITFDGSPGRFIFQHYLLAQDGVFLFENASFITVTNVTFRYIAANSRSNGMSSHLFYVSRGSHDLVFNNIVASHLQASDVPGASYGLNGLQVYTGGSGASVYHITAKNWSISGANWAVVLRNHTTGVLLDGWTVTDCGHGVDAAVDLGSDNTGTYRNVHISKSAGTPLIRGEMTDGGGNSV